MWRSVFENARCMKGLIIRALHIISGGINSEYCIAAYLVSKEICRLRRKSGLLFAALYLKQCKVALIRYYGEDESPLHSLSSPQVSLSRSGLPRIIPAFHRRLIRTRNARADTCVKIYLSWLSLCHMVLLAAKVTSKTFESFSQISTSERSIALSYLIADSAIMKILDRYVPFHATVPLELGFRWAPTWKATPNMPRTEGVKKPSLYSALFQEIDVFQHITKYYKPSLIGERGLVSLSIAELTPPFIHYSGNPKTVDGVGYLARTSVQADRHRAGFVKVIDSVRAAFAFYGPRLLPLSASRVAAVMAGAGKRRLFVIGNYCIQRTLRPVHDWAMAILRRLPSDGTYNQLGPIARVAGSSFVASYDLKSATDRWPRHFVAKTLSCLMGARLAAQVVHGCLGETGLSTGPPLTKKRRTISNSVGMLLGYYGAWPLFSLSHHLLVWMAAEKVYPGLTFRSYGILGDDLIIGDRKVAEVYARRLSDLGVEMSLSKSLVSKVGAFEFAKRFYIRRGSFDCSPISMRACSLARSTLGLATLRTQYRIEKTSTILRLAGAGYRVLSRLSPPRLTGRWSRLVKYLSYSTAFKGIAFEWWLMDFSGPLCPYWKGRLYSWLLSRVKPKQLVLPPSPEGRLDQVLEFGEYSITREWVLLWLKHLAWYATLHLEGLGRLSDLLDAPKVETVWYRRTVDTSVHRFGDVWRLYNKVARYRTERLTVLVLDERNPRQEQLQYPVIWIGRVIH